MIRWIKTSFIVLGERITFAIFSYYVKKIRKINDRYKYLKACDHEKFDRLHIKFVRADRKVDKWLNTLNELDDYVNKELDRVK